MNRVKTLRRGARIAYGAIASALVIGIAPCGMASLAAQTSRQLPYWAALAKGEARMRVGPSLDYPADWVYQRKGLPVKVVQVVGNWRKIEDVDHTQGWMHVAMLTGKPTAMVIGDVVEMRESPAETASIRYRAQGGVIGYMSDCSNGWCAFETGGKRGFVLQKYLWGGTK